jgi:pyruvate kinase
MRRTRIVATIGPASESPERLEALIEAGVDVVRLNFSHGTREEHGRVAEAVRDIAGRTERPIGILGDLAGPKVRTGPVENGPVTLESGQSFVLTTEDVPGDAHRVSLTYKELPADIQPGDTLLVADGEIELKVESETPEEIRTRVVVGGDLDSHKGINVPSRSIHAPIMGEKDKADLTYALGHGVDYVAVSFVQNADDIREIRSVAEAAGKNAALIAKIEKRAALDNIDEIIEVVEGLMVARGDLGVEIPIEQIPKVQKMLIEKTNRAGKPVITATQMLRSMVDNPRPTRAEVTDVANAILDGSDAVMLSEETAVGSYPEEAVRMMARIAEETETIFPFDAWTSRFADGRKLRPEAAVAHSACQIADDVRASAIITFTQSGYTARLVAKHRPRQRILALTPEPETYRRLALVWGATPILTGPQDRIGDVERVAVEIARNSGHVKPGDPVVITAGYPLAVPGTTNLIKIAVA